LLVAVKFSQMVQVVEMSHKEKVEMYGMIEKERLIEMLIEANNVIRRLTPIVTEAALSGYKCLHEWDEGHNNVSKCKKCGKYSA